MRGIFGKIERVISTMLFGLLVPLFAVVLAYSFIDNPYEAFRRDIVFNQQASGNYVGFIAGFLVYGLFTILLVFFPRRRHNRSWFMSFTHELTHTLVALIFWGKIHEFVVRKGECYVTYNSGPVGALPITLSPYCIPIYTFMLFPFRFTGSSQYMIVFDFLIAFTYAFHVHTFMKQTGFWQSDIQSSGKLRSVVFITCIHLAVISVLLAVPNGGVVNALESVFWEYPREIVSHLPEWMDKLTN